jgi:hypothetical protein
MPNFDSNCSFRCSNNLIHLLVPPFGVTMVNSYKNDLKIITKNNILNLYGCFVKNVDFSMSNTNLYDVEINVNYYELTPLSINEMRSKKLKRILDESNL